MNENRTPSFGPSVGAGDVLQRHRGQTRDAITAELVSSGDEAIEILDTVTPLPLRRRVEEVQRALVDMLIDDRGECLNHARPPFPEGDRAVSRAAPAPARHTLALMPPPPSNPSRRHVIEISSDED